MGGGGVKLLRLINVPRGLTRDKGSRAVLTDTFLAVGSEPEPLGARTLIRTLAVGAKSLTAAVIDTALVHV